ncbi:hypothetical protein JW756_03580 [Candidatus Woesearchaeota archaeon]|nr:hypothetical protein [Candidatus Woesearchaeota archaeon]
MDESKQQSAEEFETGDYSNKDVSVLYQKMHSVSDDELEKIKEEGINRPHSGLVERVYEVLNERALREAKADEDQITRFLNAYAVGDLKEMVSVAQLYSVRIRLPNQKELDRGLRNAVAAGWYSIDDKETSAGWFYQMLYGDGFFQKFSLTGETTEKVLDENRKEKEERKEITVPYERFSLKIKDRVNMEHLVSTGYLSREVLEKQNAEEQNGG